MNKKDKYKRLLATAKSVLSPDDHILSRYANACALIKEEFDWLWIGFYLADDVKNYLYLGPFQGPLACSYVPFTKGVCGKAYTDAKTQIVSDVSMFPGHIACSSQSKSEIVIPLLNSEKVVTAVLDIDSSELSSFDDVDKYFLEELVTYIT
jgi:GAF domain-containing protein